MTLAIILAMLKQEYASTIGLSDKSFNALAEQLLEQLGASATGEQAEEAVKAIGKTLKVIQTESDIHRAKIKKELEKKKAEEKPEEEVEEEEPEKKGGAIPGNDKPKKKSGNDDDSPAWAKKLLEEVKSLKEEQAALKAEKSTATRKSQFETLLEGLPDAVRKSQVKDFERLSFKDDEDFTTWIEDKKADVDGLKQSLVSEDATKFGPTTPKSTGGGGQTQQASKQDIADVFSSFNL